MTGKKDKGKRTEFLNSAKRRNKKIPLETKMEIIRMLQDGITNSQVSRDMGLAQSTVSTIWKDAPKIEEKYAAISAVSDSNVGPVIQNSKFPKCKIILGIQKSNNIINQGMQSSTVHDAMHGSKNNTEQIIQNSIAGAATQISDNENEQPLQNYTVGSESYTNDNNMEQTVQNSVEVATSQVNNSEREQTFQYSSVVSTAHVNDSRDKIIEEMEELLLLWIDDSMNKNIPLSYATIITKAQSLFDYLKEKSGSNETFVGSTDWFKKFRPHIPQVCPSFKLHGETLGAEEQEAATVLKDFLANVKGDFSLDLIFNVLETRLHWKKLPSQIKEENALGCNAAFDRFTLLLGANASGNLKLKPMLINHSETPDALKGLNKETLPVYWKSNKKAKVTHSAFLDWYQKYFCPTVLQLCKENNLPTRVILLLENAPGYPPNLSEVRTSLEVNVFFFKRNSASVKQPMDCGVIARFKAYYLRQIFTEMAEYLDWSKKTIKDYWDSFDILESINTIHKAWEEVSVSCLKGAWCKLLPDDRLVEVSAEDSIDSIVEDIRKLAKEVGLNEITDDNIKQLLKSHDQVLSNKDLEELKTQLNQQELENADEEPPLRTIETLILQNYLSVIMKSADRLCKMDLDWERSTNVKRGIRESIRPYSEFLRKKLHCSTHYTRKREDPKPGNSSQN